MYTYSRHASFFRAVCHIGVTSRIINRRDRRNSLGRHDTSVFQSIFYVTTLTDYDRFGRRNMGTLSGAKFEPFRDHNCGLRRFCPLKPTYSDREIHKLTNRENFFLLHRHFEPGCFYHKCMENKCCSWKENS